MLFLSPQDFAAALFFLIGHVFQRFHVRKFRLWEGLLAAGLVLVGSRFWHMEMADVCYDNRLLLPYLVTAVLGTWMIYSLPWQRLGGRAATMVRFVGDSTLTILTWHLLSFKLVSLLIIYRYGLPIARLAEFPVIEEYSRQGWWLAYFLGALLATCAIARCNRHVRSPWLKL